MYVYKLPIYIRGCNEERFSRNDVYRCCCWNCWLPIDARKFGSCSMCACGRCCCWDWNPNSRRINTFNAARKSFKWYAYKRGFTAEFKCDRMIQKNVTIGGTKQSGQNALIQFMVYNGNQHIIKNKTIMDKFCVAFTSRFWAAPRTLSIVPPPAPEPQPNPLVLRLLLPP